MRKAIVTTVICGAVLLAGCGGRWAHPTLEGDELMSTYKTDHYECTVEATSGKYRQWIYRQCMENRGWVLEGAIL